ncbi:hypothetical protein BSKO_01730 [Bryopsis sp. KO-2023]|nr:hypothetical protein BSKO_01730 [Bryopsis sp. KO-2023]
MKAHMLLQCARARHFGLLHTRSLPLSLSDINSHWRTSRRLCQGEGVQGKRSNVEEIQYDTLESGKQQQIIAYLEFLLEKNKVMNLTAVKGMEEAIDRHANDSLTMVSAIEENYGARDECLKVIDVGSGAGLPGVMVAIARDQWQVTILDTLKKRCGFVDEATSKCGIKNVQTLWARAEEAGRMDDHREVYDISIARAVAELRVLVEYCLPFVKVGGLLVAAKGPVIEEEVELARNAIEKLGGCLVGVSKVNSFSDDGKRTVVVIKKVTTTPRKYPRRPGLPAKRPL